MECFLFHSTISTEGSFLLLLLYIALSLSLCVRVPDVTFPSSGVTLCEVNPMLVENN